MRVNKSIPTICLALGHALIGYGQNSGQDIQFPSASDFVSSPLRNSITLELNATASEVWALVGRLERMPEYSSGLKKVDAQYDTFDQCLGFTCTFLPMEAGMPETTHAEIMKWYKPNVGLASIAEEPNTFGLKNSLGILTLESKGNNTLFRWSQHFDSDDMETLKMNIEGFRLALNEDIANNLIKTFGGRIVESYVQQF
ncbi:SRPBCC family protein [Flagellimonas sp. 2504JD4-2]